MSRKRSRDDVRVMEKDKEKGRLEEKKKNNNNEGTTVTTPVIHRLFTPEEEIGLTEDMIYYARKKGHDPRDEVNDFHDFKVRRCKLSSDISAQQPKNKMRGWLRSFKANKEKERTPHQSRVFELLEKLWAVNVETLGLEKKNDDNLNHVGPKDGGGGGATTAAAAAASGSGGGGDSSGLLGFIRNASSSAGDALDKELLRQGLQMMDESQRRNLEMRWREVEVQKMEIAADQSFLLYDCIRGILGAFDSSN